MKISTSTIEKIVHPGQKGAVRWKRHTRFSFELWDSTLKTRRHAIVVERGAGNWEVVDRTGRKPAIDPPVRSIIYPVSTPHAAWELYRNDWCVKTK